MMHFRGYLNLEVLVLVPDRIGYLQSVNFVFRYGRTKSLKPAKSCCFVKLPTLETPLPQLEIEPCRLFHHICRHKSDVSAEIAGNRYGRSRAVVVSEACIPGRSRCGRMPA